MSNNSTSPPPKKNQSINISFFFLISKSSFKIVGNSNTDHYNCLTQQDYQRSLDLVQDIILATDLAHHLRIVKDLRKMAKG